MLKQHNDVYAHCLVSFVKIHLCSSLSFYFLGHALLNISEEEVTVHHQGAIRMLWPYFYETDLSYTPSRCNCIIKQSFKSFSGDSKHTHTCTRAHTNIQPNNDCNCLKSQVTDVRQIFHYIIFQLPSKRACGAYFFQYLHVFNSKRRLSRCLCISSRGCDESVLPVGNYSIWQWENLSPWWQASVLLATLWRPSRENDSIFWISWCCLPVYSCYSWKVDRG